MKKSQQTILKMIVPRLFPIVHMRSGPDHLRPAAKYFFFCFEQIAFALYFSMSMCYTCLTVPTIQHKEGVDCEE